MAEKEARQSEAAKAIDHLALEMQIDREIDSLFVPAVERAQATTEESKAAEQSRNFSEARPGPDIQESAGNSGAGLNLDALQVEVDKEIDSLFVPAVKPGRNEGTVQTGHHEQPERAQRTAEESKAAEQSRNFSEARPGPDIQESAGNSGAGLNLDALQVEVDKEIDSLFVPAVKPGRNEGTVQTGHHEQPERAQRTAEESKAAEQSRNFSEARPGPGIQKSAGNSGAGLNLDALQVEVDKEIDSLFVPAVKPGRNEGTVQTGHHEQPERAQRTAEESKAAEQSRNFSEARPGPGIQKSAGNSGAGFNLDTLQVEIDKEIDSLFVPAVKPGRNEGPVQTGHHEQPKRMAEESKAAEKTRNFPESRPDPRIQELPESPGAGLNLDALQVEIDKEIDSIFVPAVKPGRNEGPVQTGHHEQPKRTAEESKAAEKTRNFPESRPDPRIQESVGNSGVGFNLDSLQVEVDKEIDSLFVPAVKPGRNEGTVQTGHHEQPKRAQATAEESKAAEKTRNFPEARPSPGIQESAGNSGAGFNLDSLQVEIDKEIDGLFVPAVEPARNDGPVQTGNHEQPKRAQETTEESKAAEQTRDFPESRPGPGIQESEANSGAGFNLDSLHLEIDKEIDGLFVPAVEPARNDGPVQTGNHEQPKRAQDRSLVMEEQSLRGTQKAGGPSLEPSHGAGLCAKYDESPQDDASDSRRHHFHELSKLIEMFNAAYLSLDWELSRENIRKFLDALHQLEPFAARSADAGSVFRILDVILKRLADKPRAVNSKLVQLIRDSQGLLAHMLLVEGETGPHEKQGVKDLIERFQELRQRALAAKAQATRPSADENAQPPSPSPKEQPPAEDRPAQVLPEPGKASPQEFLELVEKAYPLSEDLEIIDTQIARLRKIETTLARTPALVPIAQRLNGIGRALEEQVDTVRSRRNAVIDRISQIKKSEVDCSPGDIKTQEHEGTKSFEAQTAEVSQNAGHKILQLFNRIFRIKKTEIDWSPGEIETQEHEGNKSLEAQAGEVSRNAGHKILQLINRIFRIKKTEIDCSPGEIKTQKHVGTKSLEAQAAEVSQNAGHKILHLTALDGQTLAIPASCALRIAQSSEKKGLRILERGYATLTNFKPYFRGIKSGVLGEWRKLPGKKLRSYRFELVALDSFNQAEAPWQIAVLASDGQKHAVLFAETADFTADAGTDGGPQTKGPRETVETISGLLAPDCVPCSQTVPDQLSSTSSTADRFERR